MWIWRVIGEYALQFIPTESDHTNSGAASSQQSVRCGRPRAQPKRDCELVDISRHVTKILRDTGCHQDSGRSTGHDKSMNQDWYCTGKAIAQIMFVSVVSMYDKLKTQILFFIKVASMRLFCTTTCWYAHWTTWSLLRVKVCSEGNSQLFGQVSWVIHAKWNAFHISWKFLAVRVVLERRGLCFPDICAADVAPGQTFQHQWCVFVCSCFNVEPRSLRSFFFNTAKTKRRRLLTSGLTGAY